MLEHELSVGVCVILMLTYGFYLIFSLKTHQNLFNPEPEGGGAGEPAGDEHGHGTWSRAGRSGRCWWRRRSSR